VKLLMVCLGNICRSPLAEGALRARLAQARMDWVEVDSAGTGGWHAGEPPDRRSIAVAAEMGVDIRAQRARKLHAADFDTFDWLLCADYSVLRDVRAMAPAGASAGTALLMEWAEQGAEAASATSQSAVGGEIPDPYTGNQEDFRRVWRMVDAAAGHIVRRLKPSSGAYRPDATAIDS
jgi:protein-tyrosine phosphatase